MFYIKTGKMEDHSSFLKNKIFFDSPNKNIVPLSTSMDENGNLSIANCSINNLVERYGSPISVSYTHLTLPTKNEV